MTEHAHITGSREGHRVTQENVGKCLKLSCQQAGVSRLVGFLGNQFDKSVIISLSLCLTTTFLSTFPGFQLNSLSLLKFFNGSLTQFCLKSA